MFITQFNLGYLEDSRILRFHRSPDDWMESRIELFKRYTIPTLLAQLDRSFRWLVLVDRNTDEFFLNQLHDCNSRNVFSIINTSASDFRNDVIRFLKSELLGETIVTVRLDSDDGFFPHFVSFLRTKTLQVESFPTGLNFDWGLIADTNTGILYKKKFRSNFEAIHFSVW